MNRIAPALLCAVLLASCATPMAPTGGPPDDLPPDVLDSTPAPGSVNVSRESIRMTFSEYVNESSFQQALSITPTPAGAPDITWSGRSVEIRLPDPPRPNTTYVLTLDTNLRDLHGVSLASPITLAFSTGPTINAGTLTGRVVLPGAGEPAAGVDVFAYALTDRAAPDTLPTRSDYRTQTDQSGAFRFDYLTEQHYFVAAVRDQNRNLYPDPAEAFAAPPVPAVFADSTPVALEVPWVLARLDTTPPSPLDVQSLASSRHALRLTEPVRFADRDPSRWELVDSASGEPVDILRLYARDDSRQVFFTTPELPARAFTLRPAALVDTSGNAVVPRSIAFTPSAAEDTLQLRFLGFLPADTSGPIRTLPRGVEPGLRFNEPVDERQLGETVRVVDSTGTALAFSAVTDDGTNYELTPDPSLRASGRIEVRIDGSALSNPDSVFTAAYRRLPASETGELLGLVASDVHPVVVEADPAEIEAGLVVPNYEVRADSTGVFLFSGLPAGTYHVHAYADRNEDGRWSVGTLQPYRPPEPIEWLSEPSRVRARWETSLPDTLRIAAPL